jgi:alpha/beta superfamily hydrolase
MALRAISGDPRVAAYLGVGLPVATPSVMDAPLPRVPSLFVVGERDTFGPPRLLREFLGDSYEIVEIAGADHFFEGKLEVLEEAIASFLAKLGLPARVP